MDHKVTMINIKKIWTIIITIIMISNVLAIAVTPSHTTKTPLSIPIGGSGKAFIDIQNSGEDTIMINIIKGREMVSNWQEIEGKEIQISSKETGKKINFDIEIPKNAKNGDIYEIKASIKTASKNKGMLSFNSEIITTIPIIIGPAEKTHENVPSLWNDNLTYEKPASKSYEKVLVLLIAIIGILVVVKIMILLTRKKKE